MLGPERAEMTTGKRGRKIDPADAKAVGRKAFVEAVYQCRFSPAQLAAVDAAAGSTMRTTWIRERIESMATAPRDWRALAAARELLEVVRDSDPGNALITVTMRFGAGGGVMVEAAARAAGMRPASWIREAALAAAMPDLYRDAAKLVALAMRLDA